MKFSQNKLELESNGFSITGSLYSKNEITQILNCLEKTNKSGDSFLKTKDLFAIRKLFINVPEIADLLFNDSLRTLLAQFFKDDYFLTKAIYFDKPSESNWFVTYHQDLSISVNKKAALSAYKNWTFKKGQYGVQPPLKILQDTLTVRIHLDDTDENNGALKVIPGSHLRGVTRKETIDLKIETASICEVKKGAVMLMKPLTMHASSRTTNNMKRRVIHLEFNQHCLPQPLEWLEKYEVKSYQ